MTSDAKIGLLLGLVFIFIIAFIINGLPSFQKENTNELTTNMLTQQNEQLGLAQRERKAHQVITPIKLPQNPDTKSIEQPNVRYEAPLPKSSHVAKEPEKTIKIKYPIEPTIAQKPQKVIIIKQPLPKTYVVTEGDNLASIAKKFYGPEEGNRKINIDRIFKANGKLKSPDDIYIGQKLVIPPLLGSLKDKDKIENVFSGKMFKKVESIGRRSIIPIKKQQTKQQNTYVVQDGDSLWKIAAAKLGDGNRYTEIVRLNDKILENEDVVCVGMRLKMPAR
jgi:nucleoid-associated protein YgaU